jgi:general stress protein 26
MAEKKPTDNPALAREKFHDLVRSFDLAMLVTHATDGDSHARPMGVAGIDDDDTLWFNARADSPKIQELQRDPRALVVMQGSSKQLTVNGHIAVTRDQAKIDSLWRDTWRVYFESKNDPQLVLLRLTPEHAEYWDNSGVEGLKYIAKAAKAYFSGKQIADAEDPDVHGRVQV